MTNIVIQGEELYHFGILGQKWGIRRYQNPDGSLTESGKKRYLKDFASDKKGASIGEGHRVYRISTQRKSDLSDEKIYVNNTKEKNDFFTISLGTDRLYTNGKVFVQEYVTKNKIKVPDKKTMEKIELGLLKDKDVQKELVDSLMKKGLTREAATENVRAYSAGKEFMDKLKAAGALTGIYATAFGVSGLTAGPMGGAIGAGIGAIAGLGLSTPIITSGNKDKKRALTVVRNSYGDKNNKILNKKLEEELSKRGYNALKDYNDRTAFGKNGEQAAIIFNSKNNLKLVSSKELTKTEYGQAYARNYLAQHPKSKLEFNDLVKDGEAKYQQTYDNGVLYRHREEINKQILAADKAKKK